MQYILLERFYALEHENEALKKELAEKNEKLKS